MIIRLSLRISILYVLLNLTFSLQLLQDVNNDYVYNISHNLPDNFSFLSINFIKEVQELSLLGILLKGFGSSNVSEECRNSLGNLTIGLKNENSNAIKFVDATGKIPPGISLGHFSFFGSFDECLDVDYPDKENSTFHGKYCSVYFETGSKITEKMISKDFFSHSRKYFKFRWDVCLPNSCQENDIKLSILNFLKDKIRLDENDLKVSLGKCTSRDVSNLKGNQIVALIVFAILGTLLLCGTLVDIFLKIKNTFSGTPQLAVTGKASEALLCFSLYKNGLKLFNTDTPSSNLAAINGIRFLSICWLIFAHIILFSSSLLGNQKAVDELERNIIFQPMVNAPVAVDTFFFISGLLVTFIVVKAHKKYGSINWILFYVHRIWRLFPSLGAVVLFSFIFPLLGSGPTWHDDELNKFIDCETTWWKMMLFVNNFYKIGDMCFLHGWYLSMDVQFYVISPLILIFLIWKPKIGLLLNFTFLLAATVIPAVLGAYEFYQPTLLMLDPTIEGFTETERYIDNVYFKPYCRMGPYCVGMFVGYFLTKNATLKFSRTTKAILWCLTIACNVSVLFGTYEWSKGNSYENAQSVLYMATSRTVWATGLAWIMVACATGNGGVVNSFLSWKLFVPLGRLTYMVYLTHVMVLIAFCGMSRQITIFTGIYAMVITFGLIFVSYFVAFWASLAVEGPFLSLEKILFKIKEKPSANEKVNDESFGERNEAFDMKP